MIPKSILDAAKGFLCWDEFPDLSIQLIALQDAVGYYYPQDNGLQSILLFYNPAVEDFTEALFLLFHEAGHACQWREMTARKQGELFSRLMALDTGQEKAAFECAAWRLGQELFEKFVKNHGLSTRLYDQFTEYGRRCSASYIK